jgi:hypothetical protein
MTLTLHCHEEHQVSEQQNNQPKISQQWATIWRSNYTVAQQCAKNSAQNWDRAFVDIAHVIRLAPTCDGPQTSAKISPFVECK